jgi:hypothetical protein
VLYRLLLVVVIWRKSKKMNDTPPDIAEKASAAKQDLLPKKSGDLYNIENVDHKVEDLYFFAFCEKKASKTFSLDLVIFFLLHHCC